MAGPYSVPAPSYIFVSASVPQSGPYEYGGNLYIATLDASAFPTLYKSTDAGATWTEVGTSRTAGGFQEFGACLDFDFPSSPYLYVLYNSEADGFGDYHAQVSRFDFSSDTWDLDGSGGPVIPPTYIGFGLHIAMSDDSGGMGILFHQSAGTGGDLKASVALVDAALTGWSSVVEVVGQADLDGYAGVGIATGTSGRIHGIIVDGTAAEISHTLVRTSSGLVGGASLDFISTAGADDDSVCGDGSGRIAIAFNDSTLRSAVADSADIPTWTLADVDLTDGGFKVVFEDSGTFRIGYRLTGGTDLITATYSAGTWVGASVLLAATNSALPSGRAITGGFGLVYTEDFSDTWFISNVGAVGITLTGTTIPSGESFFKTHGITGGGAPEQCAPVTIVQPVDCGPVPVEPPAPGQRNTCPLGNGFSL